MKVKYLVLGLILLFGVMLIGFSGIEDNSYLRIHIRANSNSEKDQNLKYQVKDKLVEYITPHIYKCTSKKEVEEILNSQMENIGKYIEGILQEEGVYYGCNVRINNEFFPTRTYDNLTLEADYYDAIIVELGGGKGDNWWCVVYPPLCFKDTKNIFYKSKILELIDDFF